MDRSPSMAFRFLAPVCPLVHESQTSMTVSACSPFGRVASSLTFSFRRTCKGVFRSQR
jgi:hypothetical protein